MIQKIFKKKKSKIKFILYLSLTGLLLINGVSCSTTSKKDDIEYHIIHVDSSEKENRNKFKIEAYFDSENYTKKEIERIVKAINSSVEDTIARKKDLKLFITIYSSEKIRNTDKSQHLAVSRFLKSESNDVEITYNENKINALNDLNNKEFIEFTKLLKNNNSDLYQITTELNNRFMDVKTEMINEFGINWSSSNNADVLYDKEEKKLVEKKKEIFDKYNFPDSLEYKIYTYLNYCK
ncbi:hypothetical protein [Myroides odoratus]|uniref:hypothetical protein n=1 Tax=Myroides odoratus TaxID=256 RepID=UPI00334201BF